MEISKVKINQDGRLRAYYKNDKGEDKLISYPKLIMEEYLGRKLLDDEVVHHINGNPLDNDISNLQVLTKSEHAKLHNTVYHDKEAVCEVCGKTFIWTSIRQRRYYTDLKRGLNRIISCSASCSSKRARDTQLGR